MNLSMCVFWRIVDELHCRLFRSNCRYKQETNLNPKINSPSITGHKREYERLYSGKDNRFWETLDSPWYSFVCAHLPELQNRSVLEIACGRGAFSCYMSRLGATVYAVDIAEAALCIGRQKAVEEKLTTKFICGSMYDIPFPDSFFDIVVSCETIEHLEYPDQGLREVVRVIKRGGQLYLTTENYLNLVGLYRLSLWLRGREFDSGGGAQPVEQPFTFFSVLNRLRSLGARVILSEAAVHQVWIPKRGLYTVKLVDRMPVFQRLTKYFGRHVFFITTIDK